MSFLPHKPLKFFEELGAVIDLIEKQGRFGLKARIQYVAGT